MANIQAELAAILAAVYGEEVRGSIHNAIKKINDVSEVVLTTGTAVDSPTSPTTGFFDGSLYLNTITNELWKSNGSMWVSQGFLKGEKGDKGEDGVNGNKWYRGRLVSATTLTAAIDANEGDNYLNIDEGKIYHCTVAGNPSTWVYDMTLTGGGGGGGTSDYAELDNKPKIENHELIAGNNTAASLGLAKKTDVDSKYTKPSSGIPQSDLANEINEKLYETADDVPTIKNATTNDKLVSALGVQRFANRYTERFTFVINAGETVFGEWQDGEPSTWEIDEEHFLFAEELYEADDEEIELTFLFDSSCNEPIYLGGYQYVSQHVANGKNVGCLCVKLGNEPSTNVTIAVDVTHLHRERTDYRG